MDYQIFINVNLIELDSRHLRIEINESVTIDPSLLIKLFIKMISLLKFIFLKALDPS